MNETSPRDVAVKQMPIELSQFLKFGGLVDSGGQAKQAIGAGRVLLNGAVETRKSRKLAPGDRVTLDGQTITVVSA
jgi:ribosome-associated protein